tara:strand:- start:91 stop:1464 length:1374 start_codon:yes stop_codon:yes gene_type:complete
LNIKQNPNSNLKVLVSGASGFIGKKLVERLLKSNISVRAISRNIENLSELKHNNLEKMEINALNYNELVNALSGIDVAYFLIHSMEGESNNWTKFIELDKKIAKNFAMAATEGNVKRIIYLSGLVSVPDREMSKHMASRKEVGEILKTSKAKVTIFRASVIIGNGSGGFKMMHYLVERLPIMICPRWVLTKLQPIFVDDVISYLFESLFKRETEGKMFDVGGPDTIPYKDLMKLYAKKNNKTIRMIIIPFLSLRLTSYWVDLITPMKKSLTRPLVEGLKNESVITENSIKKIIPLKLKGVDQSLDIAIGTQIQNQKHTARKEILLSYLLILLGITGAAHYWVDERIMSMHLLGHISTGIWFLLLLVGYFFIKKGARLGALLAGIVGWTAALFLLIDSMYLISYLPKIGSYTVSKGIAILGNYPDANTVLLNIMGLFVIAILLVVAHFTFYDKNKNVK